MSLNLYKVNADKTISPCPEVIETSAVRITHPTEEVANKFGYWPLEETPAPEPEEGYKILDGGYAYKDVDGGKKLVVHIWRKLVIVDNPPEVPEGWAIAEDHWEEQGDQWVHVYKVLEKVDNPPSLEEGQQIIENHWEIQTVEVPGEQPAFTPTQVVDPDGNPVFDADGNPVMTEPPEPSVILVEKYVHVYTVRFVVDNPPALKENEFIYEEHWDDDGTTRTHVYDVWTLVEIKPEEQEGYRLCDLGIVDDPTTKTRTHTWKNKLVIDEKPADDPEGNFWWVKDHEDETDDTITVVYRQIFKVWRVFSKLKLEYVAFKMGLLSKLDEFLDAEKLTNDQGEQVALKRFYDQANELGEKHELFKPYYHKALEVLGLTEEQGEAILEQIVAEPTVTENDAQGSEGTPA